MKLPRGVSSERLTRTLERLGYDVIRQRGSHVRMRHSGPPAHSITIPMHRSLEIGTLHGLLSEVAQMRSITIESIAELL